MNYNELLSAIEQTKAEIYHVKQMIEDSTNRKERRRLEYRLKELQYLQLWQLGQLEWKR